MASLFIDLQGSELSAQEREYLHHPNVGGVILFTRNYQSPEQLSHLADAIHSVDENLIVSADQEGGRVQRFRAGFTLLPPMSKYGQAYLKNRANALSLAKQGGITIAYELIERGVNLSFAPILDLGFPESRVIGDRAFSQEPSHLIELAKAWIEGMNQVGMAAVGKHFPGHGSVSEDSHVEIPVDSRSFEEIEALDLKPFVKCIDEVSGLMPAHVIYSSVCSQPAGFSHKWVTEILKQKMGFGGSVFSDDLSMEAAAQVGGYAERAELAVSAGCDVLLACNHPESVEPILNVLDQTKPADTSTLMSNKRKWNESSDAYLVAKQATQSFYQAG